MMYEEFTNLIKTKAPTAEEYAVIERVYTSHPAFDVDSPKVKVALLYDLMGFGIFEEMIPVTVVAEQMADEIRETTAELNAIKHKRDEMFSNYKSL